MEVKLNGRLYYFDKDVKSQTHATRFLYTPQDQERYNIFLSPGQKKEKLMSCICIFCSENFVDKRYGSKMIKTKMKQTKTKQTNKQTKKPNKQTSNETKQKKQTNIKSQSKVKNKVKQNGNKKHLRIYFRLL